MGMRAQRHLFVMRACFFVCSCVSFSRDLFYNIAVI